MQRQRRRVQLIRIVLIALASAMLTLRLSGIASAESGGPFKLYLPLVQKNVLSEVRLAPVADAYVFEAGSDSNTGSRLYMVVGYDEDPVTLERTCRSLLRFSLPEVEAASVTAATLRVYYEDFFDFFDKDRLTTAFAAAESWQESTVTWGNQPGRGGKYGSVVTKASFASYHVYVEIDVTTLVREWLDGSTANHGIFLIGPEVSGSDYSTRWFASRESSHPPELVIKFR